MTDRTLDRLELDLADLVRAVDWPPTPDVATSVRMRLAAGGGRAAERSRPWIALPRLTRPMLLAILLLALIAAVAAAVAFGLPGLRITFTSDPLPTPNVPAATASVAGTAGPSPTATRPPGADLGLGTPTTLESVGSRVDFPIVLPEVDSYNANQTAEKIRKLVEKTVFKFEDTKIPVTISVGVCSINQETKDPTEFIKKADEKLYQAKAQGRNQVVA